MTLEERREPLFGAWTLLSGAATQQNQGGGKKRLGATEELSTGVPAARLGARKLGHLGQRFEGATAAAARPGGEPPVLDPRRRPRSTAPGQAQKPAAPCERWLESCGIN